MALISSNTFNGSKYPTKFHLDLYLDYSQSIANNQTTLTYTLKMRADGSYSASGSTATGYINGVAVGYFTSIPAGGTITIGTYSVTVNHNDNGVFPNTNFSATIDTPWTIGDSSVTGTLTSGNIPTIPRYANITAFNLSTINETTVQINWSADAMCDSVAYSINGMDWVYTEGLSINIGNLTANTSYSLKIAVKRYDSQLWSYSETKYISTYDYPKVVIAPTLTIEQPVTINIYNPLNRYVNVEFISNNDGSFIEGYKGTVNGNLTGFYVMANLQYDSLGENLKSSTYYIKVECSETNTIKNSSSGIYQVDSTKDRPEISDISYKDVNERTLSLTNNENSILRGYSTLRITPSLSKIASDLDTKAKFSHYLYSGIEFEEYADIVAIANTGINVTAVNSRSINSVAYAKDITFHPWFLPIISNAEIKRNTQVGSKMLISISGQSYNGYYDTDNEQNKNELLIKYYAKKNEEDDYTYGGIIPQSSINYNDEDNTFYIYNYEIFNPFEEQGLDSGEWSHLQLYYIKLEVNDTLTQNRDDINYIQYVNIGEPYYEWWRENDTNYFNVKGKFLVNGHNPFEYSTKETIIGTLENGETLYRKEFVGYLNSYAETPNINIPNISLMINSYGTIIFSNGKYQHNIGSYYDNSQKSLVQLDWENSNVKLYGGTAYANATYHLFVEYTKDNNKGGDE